MTECPLCEQDASAVMTVESGVSWSDAAGLPPHSFFDKYIMVHAAKTRFGDHKVFCHTEDDLQSKR